MTETLLTQSSIKLFGRIVSSMQYYDDTSAVGANNFLQRQLSFGNLLTNPLTFTATTGNATTNRVITITGANPPALIAGMIVTGVASAAAAGGFSNQIFSPGTRIISVTSPLTTFRVNADLLNTANAAPGLTGIAYQLPVNVARIYAFSFEGALYTLSRPSMFIVHGQGNPVDIGIAGQNARTTLDQSGVIAREWEFAAPQQDSTQELRYWEYEKGDFSLRLDTEAGPFEQILLQVALRAGADRTVSGAGVSGAGVSGAGVSGAGVSGAGVSGAGLSGAGVRR